MTVPLNKNETLFSFEILVEYVRLDTGGKLLRSWKPAVGVRLLDFPTLVIYQSDESQTGERMFTPRSDVDTSNEVIFQKGKSCLFKINLDSFHQHLSNTPLYAMVMDVRHETPKLIGSSLVSLARLVNQIKTDVEAHGIGTPSAHGERGEHDLCNLMGKKIGLISIACKLVSLGGSLISHIPENRIHSVGTTLSQGSDGTERAKMPTEAVCKTTGVMPLEQEGSCHVIYQRLKFDGHPNDVVVSEAKQTTIASTSTQTEQTRKRIKKIEIARIDYEDEPNPCPPPMFYSSSDTRQKDNDDKKFKTTIAGRDSLRLADLSTDQESSDSVMRPSKEQSGQAIVEHPAASQTPPQPPAPSHLGDAIRQLPLLNALLVELSLLNGQNQQQQPLSIHPGLAWMYTSAERPSDPASDSTKLASQTLKNDASPQQKAQQSSSPRQRHSARSVKSLISISSSNKQRRTTAKKHSPHPEKPKPKGKLTYGLTHTYRLRLQRLSTDLPKPRECREHVNLKQPKRHKNMNLRSSSSMFKRSLHLDDNIETLVSSITHVNSIQESTPPKSTDRPSISLLSSGSGSTPNRKAPSILKQTPKKKPVHFKQDKELGLRIKIPSALSQHSGCSGLESPHRHSSIPEHHPNDRGFSSTIEDEGGHGEGRWSSPQSNMSDSSSESMDQDDYQDDFTSLDPTDGYSPDPLSSPDGPGVTRVPSDPYSLNDESVRNPGLPVPVKAATSPKRSLKGTHLTRQSTRASGLSVSSDGDDVGSGYTPSAYSRHSQARSGSQDSELGGRVSVSRNPTRSRSERSDPTDDLTHYRGYSEDSFAHHNDSDPESSSLLDPNEAEEENDELGTLGLSKKYQHISNIMVNKLPGYTL
ncbi:microtubule-associated protein 10 [Clupea harengus]|uniref:Microtubule-associated protein 10 n=1 Tax=Clupea harengus TaxID=7950 RepID=A0A6P8GK95_CLUHA|nr:microtubule-associated protein 10 [Clupea harengus]